jgi:large subunit ribosomal protein L16
MLQPKRTKYRRPHIIRYEGKATAGTTVAFGEYGLVALEGTWVTARQIEAARIVMSRYTKRGGNVYIRIFPQLAKTKKPAEVRMGSGKGSPEEWVAVVKQGTVMFEMNGVAENVAREALRLAAYKLPIKCKVVKKGEE